jgi:serine/threonine protein kinase
MTEAQQQLALERARQGDGRALAALLVSFRPSLQALVGAQQPSRPGAAGLVQEALREAQRTFAQFQGRTVAEFAAWLRSLLQPSPSPTLHVDPEPPRRAARRDQTDCGSVSAPQALAPPSGADSWATWDGSGQPPHESIGRYVILQPLGGGGMGVVYKAHDPNLQRTVAIKVPRFDEPHHASPVARLRFLREARAAAAIRHPHVCPIHDVGEHDGVPYVVMAFVEGQSLAERLASRRPFDCRSAVRLAREIAEALAAVHAHGIIHRDLKPGNILLDRSGHAVLTDFGLSRFEHDTEHLTQEGALTGTPAYMAPEQARRDQVDARSDLFSLGSVLYELFTGELPFKGSTVIAVLTSLVLDRPRPVAELKPDLPPELVEVLMQLLDKDPRQRPRSAQEVVERLQAVERALAGEPTPAPRARARPTPAKTSRPRTAKVPRAAKADTHRATPQRQAPRWSRGPGKRSVVRILVGVLAGFAATFVVIWLCGPAARSTTDSEQSAARRHGVVKSSPPPLRVVLLAGQSYMSGVARTSTLDALDQDPQAGWILPKIRNPDGSWKVRDKVWVSYERGPGAIKKGPLTVGFGESDREIGPELLFGHVLGDAVEELLLVKVSQGPLSLEVEGRPPSSGGETGPYYRRMIETIRAVLANPKAHYPRYEGQGCELAGFVWFQGWNDHLRPDFLARYEDNLVNLIRDVRRDLGVPNLPVVIGELGICGKKPEPSVLTLRKAQAAAARRPEWAGTVTLVETSAYWDEQAHALYLEGYDLGRNKWKDDESLKQFEKRGSQLEFLYLGSGKSFALIGHGFAEAMKELWRQQSASSR